MTAHYIGNDINNVLGWIDDGILALDDIIIIISPTIHRSALAMLRTVPLAQRNNAAQLWASGRIKQPLLTS